MPTTLIRRLGTVVLTIHEHSWTEVALSGCPAGCKVMACHGCGAEGVIHSRVYGCRHPQAI